MRKIPTLFARDLDDMRHVTREVTHAAAWVLDGEGVATRKYDGTCVMLDEHGQWWARREVKQGKPFPAEYVAEETDPNTGKTVGWEPIEQSPFVKAWREVMANPLIDKDDLTPGTYELIGPKVNGNPEGVPHHELRLHADAERLHDVPLDYDGLAAYLKALPYEGIVWHHRDGRMAKLKRRDFAR
jgi:hypothetical protein